MLKPCTRITSPALRFSLLPLWSALAITTQLPQTAMADTVGTPWAGSAGVTESVTTINARADKKAKEGKLVERHHPRLRPNRHGLPQNPNSPKSALQANAPLTPSTPGPLAAQSVTTNFLGPTLTDTGSFPPDSMGTAGPTQFIVAVNGRFRSYNKSTGVADGALDADPDSFWSSVMTPPTTGSTATYTTDPRIRYDRLSGRWFITMVDVPYDSSIANRVMIAVSSGSTITSASSFTFFQFQNSAVLPAGNAGDFADYPTLGIDNNALYMGVNVFDLNNNYTGTTGFVIRKSSVLGAGPIVVTAFRGMAPDASSEGPASPQGVDNYDPAATEGYFIGSSNYGYGYLVLRRISTPGATPTISGNIIITVPATGDPITVPHKGNTKGTNGYLDALDDRLFAAHLRNGSLWTAHNFEVNSSGVATTGGGRNGSRWYQIQNLTSTPTLVQSGTVFDSTATNPKSYWIPSMMVSGQGHVAMGFSTAGAANYINAGTCGRLATDTVGTMQSPITEYTASTTAYNPPGDTGSPGGLRRWGDFSYTCLDPSDDMTMWTIQEYCSSTNIYGLRVAKLAAPPPATPASCSPATISTGQTGLSITLTGTQSSGSGFYDPGSGFTGRLAATVSGGVTVSSITYNSPASVTLTLNTTAASTGAKTITITNPDGQALTSASGILTLVTPPTITSLTTVNTSPTNAATVNWKLTFSSAVTGVTASNFSLSGTSATGATVGTPTTGDSGVNWNVPVTTGSSDGTLTLSLSNITGQSPTTSSTLPWTGQSYNMDKTTQAPTFTTPATNALTKSPVSVAFSLPEAAYAGSLKLLFSGTATRVLTLASSQLTAGAHAFSFNPANPTLSTEIASISGGSTIPDGSYTIILTYQDTYPNPAATVSHTGIVIDTTPPVVTPPANVTATAPTSSGAVVTYPAATATDANGVISITYSQNSGTTFPVGVTTVTVTATDSANNSATATFSVTVLTPVQSWRQTHFGTTLNSGSAADTADPNNNGIPNLTEYALGGDPTGFTTGTSILPRAARSNDNHLQLLFTRYTDRSDLILTVQAADTLAGPWTDIAQSNLGAAFSALATGATASESGSGTARAVTITDIYQTSDPSHHRRFMRLKIVDNN